MSRIKKITTWIAAFGIAGVVIAVFALRSSDDLNLKTKATRVLDTKSRKYSGDPSYDWLSEHELLLFRQEWRKSTWFFVPVRYDLETGAESRLGVSRIFSTYRGYGIPFRTELSSDRKSLLWWGNYGHTYLGTLDGSRFRSWKGWEEETHWLGNDRVVAFDFKRTGVAMARIQNVNA